MLRTCCVLGCGVTTAQDIIFFDFPTSRLLRQRWLKVITPCGKITVDSALCSKHFDKNDYEYIRGKVRLKRKVVPTLYLNTNESPEKKPVEENEKSNNNLNSNSEETNIKNDKKSPKKNIDKICESLIIKNKIEKNDEKEKNKVEKTSDHSNNIETDKSVCSDKCGINSVKSNISDNRAKDINDTKNSDKFVSDKTKIESDKSTVVNNKCTVKTDKSTVETDKCTVENDKCSSVKRKVRSKRTGKITDKKKRYYGIGVNNIDLSSDSGTDSASEVSHITIDSNKETAVEPEKQDIEELLTNYQIENTKPNMLASPQREPENCDDVQEIPSEAAPPPVYIEIAVGQDGAARNDCMLVMESVQVELDPASLMLPEREDDNREDPISLLTSSDEDDVILQEPKIDTVEVSSETDEDDMPLVKLAKTGPENLAKLFWGLYQYYCLQCKFNTTNKSDYNRHLKTHETVLHMCQNCGYTTASKSQLEKHSKKHTNDKRFKCHLCDFKAKYNMSLIYHMKCHSKVRSEGSRKRKYNCLECSYSTGRSNDLKRHRARKHGHDTDQ